MATTDNEVYGEIVDIGASYVSIGIQDSPSAYAPTATQYLAPSGEYKYDPKQDVTYSSYDGVAMFAHINEAPGEATITVSGVPEKLAAQLTGKPYDTTKGLLLDTGDPSGAPWCALSTQTFFGDVGTNYRLMQFLKGKFTLGAISAKSRGEKTDPKSRELIFHPVRTQYQWTVPDVYNPGQTVSKGLKAISADTTDAAFTVTPAQWFAQVQTPTAVTPATAISVTALPSNNATAVAVTAKPTLTFNNALVDYNGITLIKSTDNSIVSAPVTIDTAKKIVTVSPSASLTAATVYLLIVSGAVDIYGQTLATTVIKFTTA
jgi:hypothetical protein